MVLEKEGRPLLCEEGAENSMDDGVYRTELDEIPHSYTPFLSLKRSKQEAAAPTSNNLGTINGVYVPCLLNIIGVILFLRLGWAVGQAGVLGMLSIFFLAELQAVLTVFAASTIASNGMMRGGGSYYLISRSLGPEFGGAIGIQFYLLYAVGVSLYLVGLAEEIQETWFSEYTASHKTWIVVLIASIALAIITIIALLGAHAFSKVNQYLFLVQFTSIAIGTIAIFVTKPHSLPGGGKFTGVNLTTFHNNIHANYTNEFNVCDPVENCDFPHVYAIVFPLATGFMEGLNLSGDLKHPGKSIPVGSLAAIITACVIYLTLILTFASAFTGYTLRNNFTFYQEVTNNPYIIIIGVIVSCFTSALGALFGASRILQAIARDDLFRVLKFLAQGSKKGDEPQYAVLFTIIISQLCIFIGDLDLIAPICTCFFCLTYAAVNLTALLLQVTGVPNFRPTFRRSHWILSLIGLVLNVLIMIYLNPFYALVSMLSLSLLFVYLYFMAPYKAWGDISQALIYHQVRKYLLRLDVNRNHLKYWRPSILFVYMQHHLTVDHNGKVSNMTNHSTPHRNCVQLCNIFKKGGLYILGEIVLSKSFDAHIISLTNVRKQVLLQFIKQNRLKAIPHVLIADNIQAGYRNMLQCSGLGGMQVNTIAFDYMQEKKYDESAVTKDVVNELMPVANESEANDPFLIALYDALLFQKNILVLQHCHQGDIFNSVEILKKKSQQNKTIDIWMNEFRCQEQAPDGHVTLMLQLAHIVQSGRLINKKHRLKIRFLRLLDSTNPDMIADEINKLKQFAVELRLDISVENIHVLSMFSPHTRMLPENQSGFGDFIALESFERLHEVNRLITMNSKNTFLTFLALPDPRLYQNSLSTQFYQRIDILTKDLPPTVLVFTAQDESVITTCI